MANQDLKSPGRGSIFASLFVLGAGLPAAAASLSDSGSLSGLLNRPAFEPNNNAGYVWNHPGVLATFQPGGKVRLRLSKGRLVQLNFEGAAPSTLPQAESPASFPIHYYLDAPSHWHTARRFDRLRYRDLYPGVDLVFLTEGDRLEYNLELQPFAGFGNVRLRYTGANVALNPQGDLEIRAGAEVIRQHRPRAFQGDGRELACSYRRERTGEIALDVVGRDPREALLIDPTLNFSTYLGGPGFDVANGVATDSAGNFYLTGETSSGTMRGNSLPNRSSRDVWIAKLNSTASQVLYITYAGGSGNDSAKGIAVDSFGNAYVTGYTASTDFPTTSGALSTHNAGGQDAFALKLDSNGNILYSTFLGGGGSDSGFAIVVDSSGSAYIAGQTGSIAFPTTMNAMQTSNHGGISDCFVSKLNPAGNALAYSTYLGGLGLDLCSGIALDAGGNAYVTGTTYSFDFPTQAPFQSSLLGTANAFVTEFNSTGSALVYSTFLGGCIVDNGNAIAVDSTGAAYAVGTTASPDFPRSVGAAQTALAGVYNAFAAKLAPGGGSLVYSTFLGGSGSDNATAVTVDAAGQAVVGGYTSSPNFPSVAALQTAFQGVFDAFAAVVNAGGAGLVYSSWLGGGSDDRAYGVALLPGNRLLLAGSTSSSNFPTAGAIANTLSGNYDAFVLNVTYQSLPSVQNLPIEPTGVNPAGGSATTQTFTFTFQDSNGYQDLSVVDVLINNFLDGRQACYVAFVPASATSGSLYLVDDAGDGGYAGGSPISLPSTSTLRNTQCSISGAGSSVSSSGNTLTLSLAITFRPAFSGNKIFFTAARSNTQNSGWQPMGTWNVPGPAPVGPAVGGVTPARSTTIGQTYTFTFTDTNGYGDLAVVNILTNTFLDGTNACEVAFVPTSAASGYLYLLDDSGDGGYVPGSPIALPSSSILQNSQCTINGTGSSVSAKKNTLTLNLPITFSSSFAGNRVFYLAARNNSTGNSGWQAVGSATVP